MCGGRRGVTSRSGEARSAIRARDRRASYLDIPVSISARCRQNGLITLQEKFNAVNSNYSKHVRPHRTVYSISPVYSNNYVLRSVVSLLKDEGSRVQIRALYQEFLQNLYTFVLTRLKYNANSVSWRAYQTIGPGSTAYTKLRSRYNKRV